MPYKSSILFLFIALAAGVVFAFRESDGAHQINGNQWQLLSRTLNTNPGNSTDTGGRAVSIDSAQHCIDKYATVMLQHGFSSVGGQKVNIQIKRTSMITTGEVFRGKGLLDWLTQTAEQYNAAGKTLMIKIQLGIYDSTYLNTYQSNAEIKNRYRDRIAIFLMPYDSAQAVPGGIHANAAAPAGSTGGGTGYDLGGIQP
jgi:hypothetical protein